MLNDLVDKYKDQVDFYAIYLREVHPSDEYDIFNHVCFKQPKTMEERLKIVKAFRAKHTLNMPIFIDQMDDLCSYLFRASPERLFVIQNGKMLFQGGPGPSKYLPEDLDDFLVKFLKKN